MNRRHSVVAWSERQLLVVAKLPRRAVDLHVFGLEFLKHMWLDDGRSGPHEYNSAGFLAVFCPRLFDIEQVHDQLVPRTKICTTYRALRNVPDVLTNVRLDAVLSMHVSPKLCQADAWSSANFAAELRRYLVASGPG